MSGTILIRGARLLDPSAGRDAEGDLFVADGRIAPVPAAPPADARIIEAGGRALAPAFIDLHVHLREPGNDAAETIASGALAAAAGGFGAVVAMPNTNPPMDDPALVRAAIDKAAAAGFARVWPSACLTAGRAGAAAADLEALAAAGAAAFTDDGTTVTDDAVMREAMRRAAALKIVVMDHAQDHAAEKHGCMHEGAVSRRWGLPGIPSDAETRIIERDIRLAAETGCALHIQHISSRGGVELVRQARARGLRVSAEATPHHLALCDEDMKPGDANYKMNPPLRSKADRDALVAAVLDGTIACLATDHAPHTAESKARGLLHAPFGVIGLETAAGVTYDVLVRDRSMPPLDWVRAWTAGPAAVLGRPAPSLAPGAPADLVMLELGCPWDVDPARFLSKSRNTPFAGRRIHARAVCTIVGGRVAWEAPAT